MSHPMDLGTIARKLDKKGSGGYVKHEDFSSDVNLVFDNAMTHNRKVCSVGWNVVPHYFIHVFVGIVLFY